MSQRGRQNWRKAVSSAVICGLVFGQVVLVQLARAAATDISDVPMTVKNLVPANIMFMIDNSGSMNNIVPDTPFDAATTYLASCPAANVVSGGVAPPAFPTGTLDIRISNGVTKIRLSSGTNYDYGTGAGQKCFDPALRYNMRLNGTNSSSASGSCGTGFTPCFLPGSYLDAVYTGNYLNWYFGDSATGYTTAINFGAGASRKPGTQSRMEIARTASKLVLDTLDRVRVGLTTYNSGDGGELLEAMGDLSSNRTSMKTKIDALTPSGNTPLAETLSDIGRYFATGYTGNLTIHPGQSNQASVSVSTLFTANTGPGRSTSALVNNSGVSGPPAPIQYFCQRSFAVFMTDGQPQGDQSISSTLADYDGDCSGAAASNCTAGSPGGATNNFDRKIGRTYESQGSDYLDDVAKALFEIDLRPDLQPPVGSGITKTKNNIITYPIGFADEQVINDPLMQETATAGGGLFLSASNAAQLTQAFQLAADDILSKDGSAAAVAVANANVTGTDNASYSSRYNSGTWTGDLIAYPINTTTGVPDVNSPIWNSGCVDPTALIDTSDPTQGVKGCSAQTLLDLKTSATRKIISYTGTAGTSQGIQFQPTTATTTTKLSTAQQNLLNTPVSPPGLSDGAAVVAYLRGDRSGETAGTYRGRVHLLGDIINAEPAVVREPFANYADTCYATPVTGKCVTAFKTAQASRQRMVYQGANDGMLHAFNANTGVEEWAYVPNLVMGSLNNLSRKTGFVHKFYVDGTPASGDIDFSNTAGVTGNPDPVWKTILVGGLGKGGRGYFALDVTDPIPATETAAAAFVLWEFPNSATTTTVKNNIGYSYSKPIIVKTAKGWVVLIASGYNNGSDTGGDGQGYLFVLDAKTGDLIKALGTGVGSSTDPSGLAQISAYVESGDNDNTVQYVYGGDLKGNLWRFDLTATNINSWSTTKLATLVDANGDFQPITTAPELAKVNIVGGTYKRFVYVGTGLYLGDSDVPGAPAPTVVNQWATQTQTMYGLVDDLVGGAGPVITPLRSSLQQQTLTVSATNERVASATPVDFSLKKGWYVDLPASGERVVTDPSIAVGALVFPTNIPSSTACVPGGSSWFNVLDYKTGGYLTGSTAPWSSTYLGSALGSRAVLIKLPSGAIKALIRKSDASTVTTDVPVPASSASGKRVSWRELQQ